MKRPLARLCGILTAIALHHAALEHAAAVSAEPAARGPLIVAHRGLLKHAPENTLANFEACLQLRLGFEFDVRRSKDGHLVCVHDATVDRTTNGQGEVTGLTLVELTKLDAGGWFDEQFRGERIPTVEQVLALIRKHRASPVLVAVDIKGADPTIERDLVTLAQASEVLDKLLFIGRAIDSPEVRKRLREAAPAAHVACLANLSEEFESALNDRHADWVYVRYVPAGSEVQRAHSLGKRVFIAGPTVAGQEPGNWQRTIAAGVDGILTDHPLDLRLLLRSNRAGN